MAHGEDFELPRDMQEATPAHVQGVLDALDMLLIDTAEPGESSKGAASTFALLLEGRIIDSDSEYAVALEKILANQLRRMRITREQFLEKAIAEREHELSPVDDLEKFTVTRFGPDNFAQGIIFRRYLDGRRSAAHIHSYPDARGLKIDFGYDVAGVPRASVADCDELVRQLGITYVVG